MANVGIAKLFELADGLLARSSGERCAVDSYLGGLNWEHLSRVNPELCKWEVHCMRQVPSFVRLARQHIDHY